MAKSAHKRPENDLAGKKDDSSFIAVDQKSFDPSIASLFATSLGPVQRPPKSRYHDLPDTTSIEESSDDEGLETRDEEDEDAAPTDSGSAADAENVSATGSNASAASSDDDSVSGRENSGNEAVLAKIRESALNGEQDHNSKKRKRGNKNNEVEDVYMQRLAREEARDEEKRKKKQKTKLFEANEAEAVENEQESDEESYTIPMHETLVGSKDDSEEELEKAARTVFLGNVSNEAITSKAAEKQLKQHLSSFIADLADNKPPHKVDSIRFRSTAFAGALPKRAAYATKEVMDATTKSTNAYAVYSTKLAAREAVRKLNGTVVLGRHLRVDSIAHPSKVDHRRCVFVGNLGFVDDESSINTEEDGKKKKNKPPGDIEEGLWVQFAKAGKVESVRVVRDPKTRVGKGFAYVQFEDENAVEAALHFNDQKYPPLLPRKLRVVRARAQKRKEKKPSAPSSRPSTSKPKGAYTAKIPEEERSKQGRARAMLGKAGAFKSAESFVFEGHRASSKQGTSGLKLGGKKKGPNGRKARSQAWKKSGGKR